MKRSIFIVICIVMIAVFLTGCNSSEIAALQSQVDSLSKQLSEMESSKPSATASEIPEPQSTASKTPEPQATASAATATAASELPNEDTTPSSENTGATAEEIFAQLAEIDRLENELDLEGDALKLKYRNGEISREEYIAAKTEIELREDELDMQEDALELQLDALRFSQTPQNTVKAAPNTSDSNEKQIKPKNTPAPKATSKPKQTNSNGNYSEFASKKSDIEQREDALDREEDALEYQYETGQIDYQTYKSKEAEIDRQEDALDWEEDDLEYQYGYDD